MNAAMSASLDRYITGNYGEDQFRGEAELEEFIDECFSSCYLQGHNVCPLNNYCDEDCQIVKILLNEHEEAMLQRDFEMEQRREEQEEERMRHPDVD